jgi:hypothetical protein
LEGFDVDDCDGVQKLRSRSRRGAVGLQVGKCEVSAVGKHHCENEGVAANPCGTVENVCETHIQAGVIIAIEIKQSDRSVSPVGFFKSVISVSLGDGRLVKRQVDLFASGDIVKSLTMPE